ncbi:MAG: DMT family transporter [Firmicutes bacterium]|nr:DMT family transporter [Bacillota bacterium]
MSRQLKADLMLLAVTLGWGVSYILMDKALTEMGPFTLNAMRFLGAFAIAAVLGAGRLRGVSKSTVRYSFLAGVFLFGTYVGATNSVLYTSLSNAAFLCAISVIFVPPVEWLLLRRKPRGGMLFIVAMCAAGIALMTLKDDFSINREHLTGDLMGLFCAVCYGIELTVTGMAVEKDDVDAFHMGVFTLGWCGVLMAVSAFLFEKPHFPGTPAVWGSVAFLTVFCTGVAFIVQAIAQKYTTPTHVGVIFTLEPVFASVAAFLIVGEVLTPRGYLGAALLIAALILMELPLGRSKQSGGKSD